jgi:transcriptional regulator with GAF, ATPase, and Fis domain
MTGKDEIEPSGDKTSGLAPTERLRALLDISSGLAKTLDLDSLLSQVVESTFSIFKQADRCFVIFDESGKLIPKAVRARRPGGDDTRFSKTIARKTIDSMQSYLYEFKICSVMCVPLATSDGTVLGAIQLDTEDWAKKFTSDDLNMLAIVANLAGAAIEKARLHSISE